MITPPSKIVSEYFGKNVFDLPKMEHYLSKEAYKVVKKAINEGKSLTGQEADHGCNRSQGLGY